MMLKKRLSQIVSVFTISALLLSGCSGSGNGSAAQQNAQTSATQNESSAVDSGTTTDSVGESSTDANATSSDSGEKTTIVYGGWENPVLASYLAERFMEEHPDIKVEIFNNGEWLGNDQMTRLVAANQMPDIINLQDPMFPVQNDWVIDLKPYIDKESDFPVPDNFIKYGTINDKVVMIPNAVFMTGVMVNKDLLRANNIDIPEYDWTIDEFVNIVKRTTRKGSSVGTNGIDPILKYYPAQLNDELGWAAFNETTREYSLTPEWVEAANIAYDLYKADTIIWERQDAFGKPWELEEGSDERAKVEENRRSFLTEMVGEDSDALIWVKGKAGTWSDVSWSMNFDNKANNPEYTGFDWDFYPFPTKTKEDVSRPGMIIDSVGITTKCENPEAAWEFLRYITFETKGIEDRFDIIKNYSKDEAKARFPGFVNEQDYREVLEFSFIPCTTNQEIIDEWMEFNGAPEGMRYIISNMDTGFVDGFKVIPGYSEAYDRTIFGAFKEQVLTGQKSASDFADEVSKIANDITARAYDSLK